MKSKITDCSTLHRPLVVSRLPRDPAAPLPKEQVGNGRTANGGVPPPVGYSINTVLVNKGVSKNGQCTKKGLEGHPNVTRGRTTAVRMNALDRAIKAGDSKD